MALHKLILIQVGQLVTDSQEVAGVLAWMAFTAVSEQLTAEEMELWRGGSATLALIGKGAKRALSTKKIAKPLEDLRFLERSPELRQYLNSVAAVALKEVLTSLTEGTDLAQHPGSKKFRGTGAAGLIPFSSGYDESDEMKEEIVVRLLVYVSVKVVEKLAHQTA